MMRRSLAVLTTAALAAGLLAGCSPSDNPPTQDNSSAPPPVTATITVWADATRTPIITAMAAQFTADTGVAVDVVQRDFGSMRDDFISQAPTGQGPDVLIGAADWTGKFVQNGVTVPVELKAADFSPVAIEAVTYDGKIYGLPYALENLALFRNPALAPETPATMDAAIAAGQAAVAAGSAKYPFLLQTPREGGDPYHVYPIQTSFGAPVFGSTANGYDSSDLAMCGPEGQAFAAYLAKLGSEGVLATTMTADITKEAFVNGESPFIITGPWNTADFQAAIPDVAIEAVPSAGGQTASPFVSVQAFFISAKSANQIAANQFVVNYLGSKQAQLDLFKAGGRPPALTAAAEDPAVTGDPAMAGFAAVAEQGVAMPNIPAMDAVWGDWGNTESALIDNQGDPAQLWDAACASIKEKIATS
ncbi:MAG: maltose ABC transporter substrate-binding protein [Propionibacteriaceae bacterium]|jgi:arabinogalactan oligomer/maltooligosaccharide transport system substrate-binding protein|nr:maltose ABC transporter substrate-binding protein [Propionibacteriaceae bacterium]